MNEKYSTMPEYHQLCTFKLGGLFFGIDAREVQEVLPALPITRVPLASHLVTGLINLRSKIVIAIDLRKCLELPAQSTLRPSVNLIIRNGNGDLISFQVDEPGSVLTVDRADFETPPQNMQGVALKLIKGVYKLKTQLLLLLNTPAILNLVKSQNLQTNSEE